METENYFDLSKGMSFWNICYKNNLVEIKWSHIYFEDYKKLAVQYFECGYKLLIEIISSGHDNVKSNMWFFPGVFLLRQSIELGLKALLCRGYSKSTYKELTKELQECKHDLSMLFQKCCVIGETNNLSVKDKLWLQRYFDSLEKTDKKSDMFRFPFDNDFLKSYRNSILWNHKISINLVSAFLLIGRCLGLDISSALYNLQPEFMLFTNCSVANCRLEQDDLEDGYYIKIRGYAESIDFLYENKDILKETKCYPLIFMMRNTLELALKRIFYRCNSHIASFQISSSKIYSHKIKNVLWKETKPVILKYGNASDDSMWVINVVEKLINDLNEKDPRGDVFRYPTSFGLEYQFDKQIIDLENFYRCFEALLGFLRGCYFMLEEVEEI